MRGFELRQVADAGQCFEHCLRDQRMKRFASLKAPHLVLERLNAFLSPEGEA